MSYCSELHISINRRIEHKNCSHIVFILYIVSLLAKLLLNLIMEQVCYYDRAVAVAVAADSFSAGIIISKSCLFYLRFKRVFV